MLAKTKRQPTAASYAIEIACQFGVSRVRGSVGVRVGVLLLRIQRASASSRLLISVHPLGKLFTPLRRRHQAEYIIWYRPVDGDVMWLGR